MSRRTNKQRKTRRPETRSRARTAGAGRSVGLASRRASTAGHGFDHRQLHLHLDLLVDSGLTDRLPGHVDHLLDISVLHQRDGDGRSIAEFAVDELTRFGALALRLLVASEPEGAMLVADVVAASPAAATVDAVTVGALMERMYGLADGVPFLPPVPRWTLVRPVLAGSAAIVAALIGALADWTGTPASDWLVALYGVTHPDDPRGSRTVPLQRLLTEPNQLG